MRNTTRPPAKTPARRSRTIRGLQSSSQAPTRRVLPAELREIRLKEVDKSIDEGLAKLDELIGRTVEGRAYVQYHAENTTRPADPETPEEEKAWMQIAEEFSPLMREESLDDERLPKRISLRAGLESLIPLIWDEPEGARIEIELYGGDKVIFIRRPRRSKKRAA